MVSGHFGSFICLKWIKTIPGIPWLNEQLSRRYQTLSKAPRVCAFATARSAHNEAQAKENYVIDTAVYGVIALARFLKTPLTQTRKQSEL